MRLIKTNYFTDVMSVDINDYTAYQTTCDDEHFVSIINDNANELEGEVIDPSVIFVLKNVGNEENANFYSSISFCTRQRGKDTTIYQVCIVTKETGISTELFKNFLTDVFLNLSQNNSVRIAFTSNPLETTLCIKNKDYISLCIDKLLNELGVQTNEHTIL